MDSQSPSDGRRKRKRGRQSSASGLRPSESASSPGELGSMRPGAGEGSSSFVGSGSGVYFVRTVQAAFARGDGGRDEAIDQDIVPGEDDRLQAQAQVASLWKSDEVDFNSSGEPLDLLSFDDLVYWSEPYFKNWHPPFPFLHAPSFLALLERISMHGVQSLSIVESLMVQSIFSISVADRRQMPTENKRLVPSILLFSTINDAINGLSPILMQPSTLAGLQALLSIKLFLISILHLNAASRIGGVVVRIAFHLGLHRCPSRYRQFSSDDADIRRRIFWTIYSLERYLSQSLGLPLDMKDDDIDVCYADNELHESQTEDHPQREGDFTGARRSRDPRLLLLPTFLARHGRIKGMILQLRHISVNHRTTDPDDVANVEAEISRWWNEAQDLLDPHIMYDERATAPDDSQNSDLLRASHKLLLVVQKHESTILLNRPVITSGLNTSSFTVAMQKCIGASKQIVSKVYQHLCDGTNESRSSDGKIFSPLFWPGFTWCVWMSGLILLYAAAEGHYSTQVAQREADRCIKILETLSLRGSFWPGACASALKDLQKALIDKTTEGSLGAEASSPRSQAFRTSSATPTQNLRLVQNQSVFSQSDDGSQHPGRAPTESFSNHSERDSRNPRSTSHQFAQVISTATRHNAPTAVLNGQQGFMPADAGEWPGMSLNMSSMGLGGDSQNDGFDDIFQLMDASYQLSHNMYEPADIARY